MLLPECVFRLSYSIPFYGGHIEVIMELNVFFFFPDKESFYETEALEDYFAATDPEMLQF